MQRLSERHGKGSSGKGDFGMGTSGKGTSGELLAKTFWLKMDPIEVYQDLST